MVQNEDREWVIKSTKATESTRDIIIPQELADKIREQGYIYKGHPNRITRNLALVEEKLGIPHFSLHKLRHPYVKPTTKNYSGYHSSVNISPTQFAIDTLSNERNSFTLVSMDAVALKVLSPISISFIMKPKSIRFII